MWTASRIVLFGSQVPVARGLVSNSGKQGEPSYGRKPQILDSAHVAGLPSSVHHCYSSVPDVRLHHHAEHGAGAPSAVDLQRWLQVGDAGGVRVFPRILRLFRADLKADRVDWLQEDDGGVAFHPGGGLSAVYSRGQAGEFPALPHRFIRCWRGCDGVTNFSQSLYRDSGS